MIFVRVWLPCLKGFVNGFVTHHRLPCLKGGGPRQWWRDTIAENFNVSVFLNPSVFLLRKNPAPFRAREPLVGYIKVYINSNYHQYLNINLPCGMSQAPYPTNALNYVVYLNLNVISSVGFGGFRRTEKFAVMAVLKVLFDTT